MKNHEEQLLNGEIAAALDETLAAKGVQPTVGFRGGKMYLNLGNPETTAVTTLYRRGNEWEVASAARRGSDYMTWLTGTFKGDGAAPGL